MSKAPSGILKGRGKAGALWCEVSGTFRTAPPREPEPAASLPSHDPSTGNRGDEVFWEADVETEKRGPRVQR